MSVAVRHDDLRRRNRALAIGAIRDAAQASRTEIAARTQLSHSTISTISADLIAEGIVLETRDADPGTLRRGRPQVAMALNGAAGKIITMVVLYNHLSVSVLDFAGRTLSEREARVTTRSMSASELVDACIRLAREQLDRCGGIDGPLLRIVVAVQGTTDAASRVLVWSPIAAHENIDFAGGLEGAFGVPVDVQNDCNMIALALRRQNPARYGSDFIAILLSHGIGMGLVRKGELFTGTRSSGAEFGHMVHLPDGALCRCGRRGCIEAYAGNYAIRRHATGAPEDEVPLADIDDSEMSALAAAARAREGREREAFRRAGEAIGTGLGSLFALIDPAPVAMVGRGTSAFDLIEPPLRAALSRTAGGHDCATMPLATYADERPLLSLGCATRALSVVDQEIMAAGLLPGRPRAGQKVA
jgi:predicted NBD/HSP70 family sugar kinase